jgi:pyruvate carboxylase subunit B
MPKNLEDTKSLAKDIDDVIIYGMYPMTGTRFLKWKYGLEPVPQEVIPKTLAECAREAELVKKALAGKLVEKPEKPVPQKGPGIRTFNVFVDGDFFEVDVEQIGGAAPVITSITPAAQPAVAPKPAAAAAPRPVAPPAPAQAAAPAAPVAGGTKMEAPMPGMVIRYEVKEGDEVKAGDVVMVLEAMKMENSLTSPASGVVKQICCQAGQSVQKGTVLAVID